MFDNKDLIELLEDLKYRLKELVYDFTGSIDDPELLFSNIVTELDDCFDAFLE